MLGPLHSDDSSRSCEHEFYVTSKYFSRENRTRSKPARTRFFSRSSLFLDFRKGPVRRTSKRTLSLSLCRRGESEGEANILDSTLRVSGDEINRNRKRHSKGERILIRYRAESLVYKNERNVGNRLRFLGSLVGTIMHTIFQRNKGYDGTRFLQRGHPRIGIVHSSSRK